LQSLNSSLYEVQVAIVGLLQANRFVEAEQSSRAALVKFNHEITHRLWFYLGVALYQQQKLEDALSVIETATAKNPNDIDAWNVGIAILIALKRYNLAHTAARTALALQPQSAQSLANLAVTIVHLIDDSENNSSTQLKNQAKLPTIAEAIDFYQQALAIEPTQIIALTNLSVVCIQYGQPKIAKHYAMQLITHWPHNLDGYVNSAEACIQLLDFDEALRLCEQGLMLQNLTDYQFAPLHLKHGLVLAYLQRFTESAQAIQYAKTLNPEVINDYFPEMGRIAKEKNTEIKAIPKLIFLNAAFQQQMRCDWRMRSIYVKSLVEFLLHNTGDAALEVMVQFAFEMLSLPLNPVERKALIIRVATRYAELVKNMPTLQFDFSAKKDLISKQADKKRIRIGYLSPDFRTHPVGLLTANLYGLHDRKQFEIYAYSLFESETLDPITGQDVITAKIQNGCDIFTNVSKMKFEDIAKKIAEDNIDILVDLAGYTTHSKAEVLALRPAPLQISYLGFPNGTGADFIDYMILDKTVCLDGEQHLWVEQVIRLPDAYCPFDISASNGDTKLTRSSLGLPEDAIVLCCFNSNYKIEPVIFNTWMNILHAVPSSVLWLVSAREDIMQRLYTEAEARGITNSRLIFASYVPHTLHIERYQLADLFLDTYWHNAHTTAADALWQGLPVITCMGEVQSSRLAASLLNALEMPELIAQNLKEYEVLAIYYAQNNLARQTMRNKLKNKRYTAPLFDIPRTVKHIDTAYKNVWQRYCNGLPAEAFDVEPLANMVLFSEPH